MGRSTSLDPSSAHFQATGLQKISWSVLVLSIVWVMFPAASLGQGEIQVLASDQNHLRLGSGVLATQWVPRPVAGQVEVYFDLDIPGYSNVGQPGGPRVPRQGAWLVVPPGMRPVLKTVSEKWVDAGGHRLMVEAVPVILPGEDDGGRFVSEVVVPYGGSLPEGVEVPEEALAQFQKRGQQQRSQAMTLGEVSWWRGRRVVSAQLIPVLYDGQGRASRVLQEGVWEVVFVPQEKASALVSPGPARINGRGDESFGALFLNSEILQTTLPERMAASSRSEAKAFPQRGLGTLLAPEARLSVRSTRLQRVSAARLMERGLLPTLPVPESAIRLYQRRYVGPTGAGDYTEIEVPILMVGDGGDFEGDDFFVFYGLRLRDDGPYTADLGNGPVEIPGCGDPHEMNNEANIYWLAASEPPVGEAWLRMEHVTWPAAESSLDSYRRGEHHEEQVVFRENVPTPQADRVFQNSYRDMDASITISPLWSPKLDGQEATIEVGYTGFSVLPRRLRFDLYVDNVLVENLASQVYLASMVEETRTFTIPGLLLSGSSAKVVMSPDEPASGLFSYLNWVKIEYDALYQATDNDLVFNTGEGVGNRPVKVTGFTDEDIGLVDISDPRRPVVVDLQGGNIVPEGPSVTLSFVPDQVSAPRVFTARGDWHGEGILEFSYISSKLVENPVDPSVLTGPEPDLLVVTHPDFEEAITRWIDHRIERSGGTLVVKRVDVQDLYDHYSGGLHDAWAIKRFAAEAIAKWGSWALELVGDANENVRGFKVTSTARAWSKDFVPAHYHVQRALSYNPELLATDKWYATSEAGMNYPDDDYPARISSPWEMYVGRFPCNSVAELNTMIDKVITVESPQPGQDWRRRGIFFADDSWSNGYGLDALSKLTYRANENVFSGSTRDSLAPFWQGGSPVTLVADTLFLGDWLDPLWPQGAAEDRTIAMFADYAEQYALPHLLQAMNQGGLICFYQGHANQYVLCSEYWIQDELGNNFRQDIASLNNAQAPWFFFGMGCHISDWAQNAASAGTTPKERSLSEKMMVRSGGGASGTYGSSGYEYISANRVFSEKIFRRWIFHPPVYDSLGQGNTSPLPGRASTARSRWMVGELMWASEADIQAILGGDSTYREMISQYTLLGDPLMILDAGEPDVTAKFADDPQNLLSGEIALQDINGTNQRTLEIIARDEAGIDRLHFYDSLGGELNAMVVSEELPLGQVDQQEVQYILDVPIRPFAHTLTVDVFDTGAILPSDRHWSLAMTVAMDADILAAGEPLDLATFAFVPEIPVDFSLAITSAASVSENATLSLGSPNLDLMGVVIDRQGPHDLEVRFTATAKAGVSGSQREVYLDIDEGNGASRTTYVLQGGASGPSELALGRVFNYPNPIHDQTRFLIETSTGGEGVIRVFSVAGRVVATIPINLSPGAEASDIVTWDARDNRGDELANGTYMYRVELNSGPTQAVSDMQRLVVMR